jgi:hypothetical protein
MRLAPVVRHGARPGANGRLSAEGRDIKPGGLARNNLFAKPSTGLRKNTLRRNGETLRAGRSVADLLGLAQGIQRFVDS